MSKKELDRHDIISRLLREEINGTKAAELLRLSVRQTKRLKAKVKDQGLQGLVHGSRGKLGNRRVPKQERAEIAKLLHKHYPDFKPSFAAEKLEELHSIKRDPKTIRAIMIQEELWKPRKSKPCSAHRAWRQRKACFGELEQFDGSYHDWFEARAPECCLLAAIDDAKGEITKALFVPDEGVMPVFTFWKEYMLTHGKPRGIYLDKFSTYKMNPSKAKENHELKTQFQRAMEELHVEPITAHSPQARGRVERLFGTLQDRLIKEMRLEGISNWEKGNIFLKNTFIPKFNARFGVEPALKTNLHKQLSQDEEEQLDAIFSRQSERVIRNDFTLSFNNQWYQLTKQQPATVRKKDKVIIEERTDNTIWVRLRRKYLNYEILPERPQKSSQPWVLPATVVQPKPRGITKPPPDHPWRSPFPLQKRKTERPVLINNHDISISLKP